MIVRGLSGIRLLVMAMVGEIGGAALCLSQKQRKGTADDFIAAVPFP